MNIAKIITDKLIQRATGVDLSGANSIFGTIGSNKLAAMAGQGFFPIDGSGRTMSVGDGGNVQPTWIGLQSKTMQFWAYNYCSPLATVIDRLAEADTNGRIEFVNEKLETVDTVNKSPKAYRIKSLFNNPNPLQTYEELNSQQLVYCKMFGYCPVLCIAPAGFDKSYTKWMFNINPLFADPVVNYDYDIFATSGPNMNPIKEWRVRVQNRYFTIPAEDILLIKDGYIDAQSDIPGIPLSKIAGLDFFVSNICAALEADNVLLKKKGPLGVFSFDPKPDMAGWTPMKPEDKNDLQADLAKYGMTVGQLQYIISKVPIKWNSMSFNVQELMTKETVRQGIDGICDRFSYPAELMSGKNATYENRSSAEKYLYQNNIIPFSLRRMARYNQFFGLDTIQLYMDYDHIPVLQDDILKAGQSEKAKSEALTMDWQNGIITYNDYRKAKGYDTIPNMDLYYNEYMKKYPPLETNKKQGNEPAPKDTSI